MIAISLDAFCPWCGRQMQSMFDLKPDASRTLQSIACSDCHDKGLLGTFTPGENPKSRCPTCTAPLWDGWRFCVQCRGEVPRAS